MSKLCWNLDRTLDISQQWQFRILSSLRTVLNQKNSGSKIYTSNCSDRKNSSFRQLLFLQDIFINIKTRHFDSSVNLQEHLFHRTLVTNYFSPVNIAVFKSIFFKEHLKKQSLQMSFKIGVLKSFVNFTGNHLCWSLFLKNFINQYSNTGPFL